MSDTVSIPRWMQFFERPERYKGVGGGRGGGKSWGAGLKVLADSRNEAIRTVCVREVQRTLADSSKQLLTDWIERLRWGDVYTVQGDSISSTNGSLFIFRGMSESYRTANSIKSLEGFERCWIDEGQTLSERSWELLYPTIRSGRAEIFVTFNPTFETDIVYREFVANAREGFAYRKVNWQDNPLFPEKLNTDRMNDKLYKPNRYAHIWEGELMLEAEGALWEVEDIQRANLDPSLQPELHMFEKIVIGVDPAVTAKSLSDYTAYVVAGRLNGTAYIIDAQHGRWRPDEWGKRIREAERVWQAEEIIPEANQGGDLVTENLRNAGVISRIRAVRAKRGKMLRAEPVQSLYRRGRVQHLVHFADLVAEMVVFTGDGSPGRHDDLVDALVYAIVGLDLPLPGFYNSAKAQDITNELLTIEVGL